MLKAVRVSLLLLALTCSVSAGEIPNNITNPPPPPPQQSTAPGEIPNNLTGEMQGGIIQIGLTLLGLF